MGVVLEVNRAEKRFGQTQALVGASFELREREWLALLGPNGAGKTTLVRAVAGRVRLDGGTISLLGAKLNGAKDASVRDRLGVVPQELALYPLMNASENLRTFAALHGVPHRERADRVRWALEWTGLADRARDPVQRFSGGMKRRLNIACAVLHSPEVVLLDEPTVGVDPQSRERIWEMLDGLRQQGASLLLTTHQLDEAQQICDRIVIIDHGRDVAAGTLQELVAQTIGAKRQVRLKLREGSAASVLENATAENGEVRCAVDDMTTELPALLARVRDAGLHVEDMHIESPSLHAVFIHLTGRELRE
jgi:ABC-2 type transport system ATP-binding protein